MLTTDLSSMTMLLLLRGCPEYLLEEVWYVLSAEQLSTTPAGLIKQIDTAITRAKD